MLVLAHTALLAALALLQATDKKPNIVDIFGDDIDGWNLSFKLMEGDITTSALKTPNMPQVTNLRLDPFEHYPTHSKMQTCWTGD